jgi:hypothetical protein
MTDTITHPQQRAFLAAFAELGNVSKAAKVAKVSREAHYDWRRDPVYEAAFQRAILMAGAILEDEAVRRAKTGILKPVFQGGRRVGQVRVFSDALLMALLAAWMPKKYGKKLAMSGPDGAPIAHSHALDLSQLTIDELKFLERLADKAARGSRSDSGGAEAPGEAQD